LQFKAALLHSLNGNVHYVAHYNSNSPLDLNGEVEKVRADQQRLNHDLDFISSQQQELEDMLQPLEEKIKSAG